MSMLQTESPNLQWATYPSAMLPFRWARLRLVPILVRLLCRSLHPAGWGFKPGVWLLQRVYDVAAAVDTLGMSFLEIVACLSLR